MTKHEAEYVQLPNVNFAGFVPPTVGAAKGVTWRPVSEYTTEEPGTILLLWEIANGYADGPVLASVDNCEEGEDCLVFANGYLLFTSDWEHITHFAIVESPGEEVQP